MNTTLFPLVRVLPVLTTLLAIVSLPTSANAAQLPGREAPQAVAPRTPAQLADLANQELGLYASSVAELEYDRTPNAPLQLSVPFEGRTYLLDLAPHSVRSPLYDIKVQLADGSYASVAASPPRTLRGTVRGLDGSVVAGSLLDAGLYATVILPDDRKFWIEPLSPHAAGINADLHVIYRPEDVVPTGRSCAVETGNLGHTEAGTSSPAGEPCQGGFCVTELAVDTDVEYFNDYGSVPATEDRINSVINFVDVQYERDVAITHEITTIIVRTSEPDPYPTSTTDAGSLLELVRSHWQSSQGGVHRDLVQMFTGKNLNAPTIGIAYTFGRPCNSLGYSVVESDCCGSFNCTADLSAHELGHLYSADHCSCLTPPYTMNASITCARRFHPTFDFPEIEPVRDSALASGCTHVGGTICGDGEVDGTEECDPPDGLHCDANCTWICGDGVIQGNEQCDPPDGVGCDSNCQTILCGVATGNCCVGHGTPGCNDPPCCEVVCAIDQLCCSGTWDQFCAIVAQGIAECNCSEPECQNNGDCDDLLFCNGPEICNVNLQCQPGSSPCTNPSFPQCDEGGDQCVECLSAGHCDDANDCTDDQCVGFACTNDPLSNEYPCAGGLGSCLDGDCVVPCFVDQDCDDDDVCTRDQCGAGDCQYTPAIYGDVNYDGTRDLFDIFCVLDGFGSTFVDCPFFAVDIIPCPSGDGVVDLFDIFGVLDAFTGVNACGCPAGP